jgi:hypothetical protein
MNKIYFLTSLIITIPNLLHSQCITGVGPTSTIDSNVESVTLTGDVGSINYIGCPGVIGVEDQTGLATTLSPNSNYTLNVQFGTCGGNYSGAGEVWIDFNGNQVFEPFESIGTWSGTPPVAMSTFNFTVPSSVTNLPVKMRVMQHEGTSTLPLDPCGSYSWGSVVDFSIYFTGGIDCSTYVGNDESDPKIVSALPYTDNYDNSICYTNNNTVYNSPDVYYLYVPQTSNEIITASLCGSSFDTYISAYDTQGNNLAFNDDACGPQSEIEVDLTGIDSVYIIVEGWGTESGAYTLNISENTAGVSKLNSKNINLYPNPTHQSFIIDGAIQAKISIYSLNGDLVKSINNYNGTSININDLPKGIYFIQVLMDKTTITKKLTIQ